MKLPARTQMGRVRLAAADLQALRSFYVDLLGMTVAADADRQQAIRLQAGDSGATVVELVAADADGMFDRPRSPGLYHLAILHPNRAELAKTARRLVMAGWPLAGASDHGVSEAIYLSDPEGNSIELYADRPRSDWPRRSDGKLAMITAPLDLNALFAELDQASPVGDEFRLHPKTRIGHVHLHVSNLDRAAAFYVDLLGFDVMQDTYPGALFVAAGGYHHHLGLNTWAPATATAAIGDGLAPGLVNFAIVLPDQDSLNAVVERLQSAGRQVVSTPDGWLMNDDDGLGILLSISSARGSAS